MATSTSVFESDGTSAQSVVVVTVTSSQDSSQETAAPVVVTAYSTVQYTPTSSSTSSTARSSASNTTTAQRSQAGSGGLGSAGTIAIAVAVPVVVIAVLLVAAAFLWRRRKRNRTALAQRKEEHDQYAFHPNDNSFAPAVMTQYGNASAGTQPQAGAPSYRGWQPTDTAIFAPVVNATGFQPGRGSSSALQDGTAGREKDMRDNNLEKPTLPALGNMDDLDSIDGDSGQHSAWHALSPGHGSPPLNVLSTGSPSSDYSAPDNDTAYRSVPQGYSNRSAQLMPSLHPGHQRPVSNALREDLRYGE